MANASDDVKISTRIALGIVGGILAVGTAIGVPVVVGNAVNGGNQAAKIESCTTIKNPSKALACVQSVEYGAQYNLKRVTTLSTPQG